MYGEKLFSIDLKSAPIQGLHAAYITSNINVIHVPRDVNDVEALEGLLHGSDGIEVLDELWFSGLRVLFDVVSDNLRICSDYEVLMAKGFHFAKAQQQGFILGGVIG